MCLLLVSSDRFAELGDELLASALRRNSHGAGLMWHDGERLQLRRQRYVSLGQLRAWLAALPPGRPAALHLRKATAGAKTLENVHPHLVKHEGRRLAVMHNGNLGRWEGCPLRSDTARFTTDWLTGAWAEERDITSLRFGMQLRAVVPPGNRMVLADDEGRWKVVGKDEGWWLGRMWLSNPKAKAW